MNLIQIPNFEHPDWNKNAYNTLITSENSPTGSTNGVITFNLNDNSSSYIFCYLDIAPQIPEQQYNVSVWIKTDDPNCQIRFYTADNSESGRIYGNFESVTSINEWKKIMWTFVNPLNSQSDSISFQLVAQTQYTYSMFSPELSDYIPVSPPPNTITVSPDFGIIYNNNCYSIVNILMKNSTGSYSSGSGCFISDDGFILTAAHVVTDGPLPPEPYADIVYIHTFPENDIITAEIIGVDRTYDVAVLKVILNGRGYLELEDSRDIKIGEYAITLGQPLGVHVQSITTGVIRENKGSDYNWMPESVLIDGEIGPGNSGGPVLSSREKIIGILSWGYTQSGFELNGAISSHVIQPIVDYIIDNYRNNGIKGDYPTSYIGINYNPVDMFDIVTSNLNKVEGVIILDVINDSPADIAGIKVTDVVIKANGKVVGKMNNQEPLGPLIHFTTIGSDITLDILVAPNYDQVITKIITTVSLPFQYDFLFADTKKIDWIRKNHLKMYA
jgi:S1-C subfamily serine protease